MSAQSNECVCPVCTGSKCTCGCQNSVEATPAASCGGGEVCNCAETCNCKGCREANAPAN